MFQNIKVDIIYYKTNTDFEMEFNLCGCCRMRLLTDKAPDRKILVSQLARAVSRSRIIMIAGPLFGEDGLIKTAAAAIGKKIAVIDNKQFGISGEEEIEIIKDAIPLVSTDGIFGGCIIEQGPQTLILLTENKNIRKNIMQSLIHPYVQEVCAAELTEKAAEVAPTETPAETESTENSEEEPSNESQEIVTEETVSEESDLKYSAYGDSLFDDIIVDDATLTGDELIMRELESYDSEIELADEIVLEDDEYLDDNLVADEEALQNVMDGGEELFADPEYLNRRNGRRKTVEYSYMSNEADDYITEDENYDMEEAFSSMPPIERQGLNIPIIIIAVILLIVAAVLCYCIFIVPQSSGISSAQYLKEAFDTLFG